MKKGFVWVLLMITALLLSGCRAVGSELVNPMENTMEPGMTENAGPKPVLPEKLKLNEEGVPLLQVYQTDDEEIREMNIEAYLEGVLAGEMKNDWPMEALKAQAILARTFVLKFCAEKESKYEGADISTDIEEAQAYDATGINERIEQAVKETRGMVLSHNGKLPYAWFHAHSGGITAKAKEGLAYRDEEPGYTKVTQGNDSDQAPEEAKEWTARFTAEAVIKAAKEAGLENISKLETVEKGETGESGRLVTILINGESVSAPNLRIALGSTAMRSTLVTHIELENDMLIMKGRGYGHGVGMPQWGAYAMAEEGKTAQEIVEYYFEDVKIEHLW